MGILDGFERWDRKTAPRTTAPLVTIQKDGLFSLNEASFKALGEPTLVEIFYNAEKGIIAFAPTEEGNPVGYPPRKQPTGANWYIAGQMFTRHYAIDTTVARRYPAEVHDRVLFVNLTGPSAVATGARARPQNRNERERGQQGSLLDGNEKE